MWYKLLLLIFAFSLSDQAFSERRYHSQEGQFSFRIPSRWQCNYMDKWIPKNEIKEENEEYKLVSLICMPKESRNLTPPFVLFYTERCYLNGRQLENRFSSNKEQERLKNRKEARFEVVTSFHDWNLPIWQDAKLLDYSTKYDVSLHRNIESFIFLNSESKKMGIGVLTILGNKRITTLQYCLNSEYIDGTVMTNINEIINSFEYDKGFGYGQKSLLPKGLKANIKIQRLLKTRGVVLILLWIGTLFLCGIRFCLGIIIKKHQGQVPAWIKACLAAWFQVFGSFILFIAAICGYFELWIDFGVALAVGAVFCIRGFFEKFIVLRNNSSNS